MASLGAAVLGGVAQTIVPLVERQILDGVILTHTSALWPWLVLLVALAGAAFGFAYIRRYFGGRVALGVQYDLRNAMHDHLQAMDAESLARMPTGQLVESLVWLGAAIESVAADRHTHTGADRP